MLWRKTEQRGRHRVQSHCYLIYCQEGCTKKVRSGQRFPAGEPCRLLVTGVRAEGRNSKSQTCLAVDGVI